MSKIIYTKEYVSDGKKFYWNPDTLDAFRFEASYMTSAELLNSVEVFVENECSLEDGETEEMLIQDLISQILQKQ